MGKERIILKEETISLRPLFVPVDFIVSTNTAYGQRGRIRYLSKKGKSFKKNILDYLTDNYPSTRSEFFKHFGEIDTPIVRANYYLVDNWLNKDKSIKKLDLNPRIKLVEDVFFNWLGIDDNLVFCSEQRKIHSNNYKAVVYHVSLQSLSSYMEETILHHR